MKPDQPTTSPWQPDRVLDGHVALVTGSTDGIGRAIAAALARAGAYVYLNGRRADKLAETVAALSGEGLRASGKVGDVGERGFLEAFIDEIVNEQGALHILVNNAAVTHPARLAETTDEEWDDVLRVDLTGTFYGVRAAVRVMLPNGYGRIVNVTSTAGLDGSTIQTAYSAAKAGVIGLTKSVARQVAASGITVNAISPIAETAMAASIMPTDAARAAGLARIPMGRVAAPDEIAPAVVALASPQFSYTTGHVLLIDGGMSI